MADKSEQLLTNTPDRKKEIRRLNGWMIPKKGENGEYYPVARYGRFIPFGYYQDPEDEYILIPIPDELDLLEQAKRYLFEYSYRSVAKWLSDRSGRYISHVGLQKRVKQEQLRRYRASSQRNYSKRYKEAKEAAEKLEARIGGKATRYFSKNSPEGREQQDEEENCTSDSNT